MTGSSEPVAAPEPWLDPPDDPVLEPDDEPLWEPVYRQAPLSEATWEKLQRHPQFRG